MLWIIFFPGHIGVLYGVKSGPIRKSTISPKRETGQNTQKKAFTTQKKTLNGTPLLVTRKDIEWHTIISYSKLKHELETNLSILILSLRS
jgi:hypothetical protein